jgi:putative transposase
VRLNRLLAANDERVNHKRVYRLMKQDGLLLARYTGRPAERCHEGKIITLKPDLRWCSDGFEIRCRNNEVVWVAFSLDCCDREAMRYVATTGGITSEMIQDLLVESMAYRFGDIDRLPHPVEWLSDNGSCYIAEATRSFARSLT